MKRNNIEILIAISLVLMASATRIFNHEFHFHNLAPVAAIGLFSGAILKDRRSLAFLIPLLGQFLADVFFQLFTNTPGFYNLPDQLFNYGGLAAATALGVAFSNPKPASTIVYLFGASTLFFLVSNFGYFIAGHNGYTMSGFLTTYWDAVPFFKNTLTGDLIGGVMLFGSYFLAQVLMMRKMQKANA